MEPSTTRASERVRVIPDLDPRLSRSTRLAADSRQSPDYKLFDVGPSHSEHPGPQIIECIRNLRFPPLPNNRRDRKATDLPLEELELEIKWVDHDESHNTWNSLASFSNPQVMVQLLDEFQKHTPKTWRGVTKMRRLKLLQRATAYFMRQLDQGEQTEELELSALGPMSLADESRMTQLGDPSPAKTDQTPSKIVPDPSTRSSPLDTAVFSLLDQTKVEAADKEPPRAAHSPNGTTLPDPRRRNRQPAATLSASPQPRPRSPSEQVTVTKPVKQEPPSPACTPTPALSTRFQSDRTQLGQRMIVTSTAPPPTPTPSRPGSPSPAPSYYADEQSRFPYVAFEDPVLRQLLSCLCSRLAFKTDCSGFCRNCNSCTCGQRRKLARVADVGLRLPPPSPKSAESAEPAFDFYFCEDTGLPVFVVPARLGTPDKASDLLHLSAADMVRLHPAWTMQAMETVDRYLASRLQAARSQVDAVVTRTCMSVYRSTN